MTPMLGNVSAQLVSFWKPLIIFLTFLPWAWLISTKLDKDARYLHLNRHMFNTVHLLAGIAALAVMLLIPAGALSFFVGWPLGVLILLTPVLVYWRIRNAEVPEEQQFHLSGIGVGDRLAARKQARAARGAVIRFLDKQGDEFAVPVKEDPLYPIHLLAEDLIGPALEARAIQIDTAVSSKGAVVAQTVDGVRYKRDPIAAETAIKLIDYVKNIATLNVADRRRRQTGTFQLSGPTGDVIVHVTTAGSSAGEEMRIEFGRANRLLRPFDALGFLPGQMKTLRDLEEMHDRHGIVLIAAPAAQGLSTSAYSFLGRHDAYTANIKTLESEILVRIDGVDHVQWDPSNPDVDYATNLQSILRRDPDIVMAGRVADTQTARISSEPGMKGPLIYIPMRAGTIGSAIRNWVKLVGDLKQAAAPLRAVTNQRLVRTLCPNCKQAYQPSADRLTRLGLPAKVKQLHQASGKVQLKGKIEQCPVCNGTGYLGQTGVFEVLVVDDEVRRSLLAGDLKAALAIARRNKMIYLQEAALHKIVAGETTIDEVIRVTSSDKDSSATEPKRQPNPTPVVKT